MAVYFNCCPCAVPVPAHFKRHRVYKKIGTGLMSTCCGTGAWHRGLAQGPGTGACNHHDNAWNILEHVMTV